MLKIIYLAIFIFSTHGVDCSTRTLNTCALDDCKWQQGSGSCLKLDSTDCSTGERCVEGCPVTPGVAQKCEDPNIATCASKTTSETCNGACTWNSGTCSLKADVVCALDNCPAGCEMIQEITCESTNSGTSKGGPECSTLGVGTITECASDSDCAVGSGSCTGKDYCKYLSPTREASECGAGTDLMCKVQGTSCVANTDYFNDNPEAATYRDLANVMCPSVSVAALSECDVLGDNCKVSGTTCRDKTPDEICDENSVALYSQCSTYSCCTVSGSSCVLATDADSKCNVSECNSLSVVANISDCSRSGDCTVSGEQCVSNRTNCAAFTNADGTCTDAAPSGNYGCATKWVQQCVKVDCSINLVSGDCNGACEWSNDGGSCVPTTPLTCDLSKSGSGCDDSTADGDCTSTASVPAKCNVPSFEVTTCTTQTTDTGCAGTAGCKWRTAGGSCVATNNPINRASVINFPFVLVILLVLFIL